MKKVFFLLALLSIPSEAALPPVSYPLFLKQGFSCVLEFDKAPKRVVIGDLQSFQVEKMENSVVVRAITAYASSNLFVYFDVGEPRLFVLTASEDAEPTLYRKFETLKPPEFKVTPPHLAPVSKGPGILLASAKFDPKKDYLTVDARIIAGNGGAVRPEWSLARLKTGSSVLAPLKAWAERKEVQKDSSIRARFIFAKPNVRRDLKDTKLVLPVPGQAALTLNLGGN